MDLETLLKLPSFLSTYKTHLIYILMCLACTILSYKSGSNGVKKRVLCYDLYQAIEQEKQKTIDCEHQIITSLASCEAHLRPVYQNICDKKIKLLQTNFDLFQKQLCEQKND